MPLTQRVSEQETLLDHQGLVKPDLSRTPMPGLEPAMVATSGGPEAGYYIRFLQRKGGGVFVGAELKKKLIDPVSKIRERAAEIYVQGQKDAFSKLKPAATPEEIQVNKEASYHAGYKAVLQEQAQAAKIDLRDNARVDMLRKQIPNYLATNLPAVIDMTLQYGRQNLKNSTITPNDIRAVIDDMQQQGRNDQLVVLIGVWEKAIGTEDKVAFNPQVLEYNRLFIPGQTPNPEALAFANWHARYGEAFLAFSGYLATHAKERARGRELLESVMQTALIDPVAAKSIIDSATHFTDAEKNLARGRLVEYISKSFPPSDVLKVTKKPLKADDEIVGNSVVKKVAGIIKAPPADAMVTLYRVQAIIRGVESTLGFNPATQTFSPNSQSGAILIFYENHFQVKRANTALDSEGRKVLDQLTILGCATHQLEEYLRSAKQNGESPANITQLDNAATKARELYQKKYKNLQQLRAQGKI